MIFGDEWHEYYLRFPYFSHELIRDGCQPWKMVRQGSTHAIVLIHGLTDSPFFMKDLASFFYERLGYSVFIPLLQCHGLKNPQGMRGVSLEEWKGNVAFAVEQAAQHGNTISIGGLSTGGTLSMYAVQHLKQLNGCVYLFSAVLKLADGIFGILKEKLLRTYLVDIFDHIPSKKNLIGEHPYRYEYIELGAARQLAILMREVDQYLQRYNSKKLFDHWTLAFHSESDDIADINVIEGLRNKTVPEKFLFWPLAKDENVKHAGLVLAEDILCVVDGERKVMEGGNPVFSQLLGKIEEMESKMNKKLHV